MEQPPIATKPVATPGVSTVPPPASTVDVEMPPTDEDAGAVKVSPDAGAPPALTPLLSDDQLLSEAELPAPERRAAQLPTAHELARLLWFSEPNLELWSLDALGELQNPAVRLEVVDRMLRDEKFARGVAAFISSWAEFGRAAGQLGSRADYAELDVERFSRAAKIELQEFTATEIVAGAGLRRLLSQAEYGLSNSYIRQLFASEPAQPGLAPLERVGLLQQPFLQAVGATDVATIASRRGAFLSRRLLCAQMPEHGPGIPFPDVVPAPSETSLVALRRELGADPVCQSCHALIDPLGVPLEEFDPLGAYRTTEHGQALELTATMPPGVGASSGLPVSGSLQLAAALAAALEVHECFAATWFSYALGRPLDNATDASSWANIQAQAAQEQPLIEIVRTIALSESFMGCTALHQQAGRCPALR